MVSVLIHGAGLVLALAGAFLFLALGVDWLTIYQGLHPFPASAGFILCCSSAAWYITRLWEIWEDHWYW